MMLNPQESVPTPSLGTENVKPELAHFKMEANYLVLTAITPRVG